MPQERAVNTKAQLVAAATTLFRTDGYAATSIDDVCDAAGVKKGAFFYHFPNKEQLALECIRHWREATVRGLDDAVRPKRDPVARLRAALDWFVASVSRPGAVRSCLLGTTLQEVAESNEAIRAAAGGCLLEGAGFVAGLVAEAAAKTGTKADAEALGRLWMATLQGALILFKGSRDDRVVPESLSLVRGMILRAVAGE
ncbi:MAG TPA: TetR/AcrR family transcriptional regulator [Humisphaera sp.]